MLHNIFQSIKFLPNKIGVNKRRKKKKGNWHIFTRLFVLCKQKKCLRKPIVKTEEERIKTLTRLLDDLLKIGFYKLYLFFHRNFAHKLFLWKIDIDDQNILYHSSMSQPLSGKKPINQCSPKKGNLYDI